MKPSWLTRGAHLVAKYSYGIYLGHIPVMWFCFMRLAGQPRLVRWPLFAVLAVVVPVLLFHLVEQPMIKLGKRLSTPTPQPATHALSH